MIKRCRLSTRYGRNTRVPMPDDRTPGYDEYGPQDFAAVIAASSQPLSREEWDDLIASEQNATAEPFEGRR